MAYHESRPERRGFSWVALFYMVLFIAAGIVAGVYLLGE